MSVLDRVRVIIYRYHEKGLEVFLVNQTAMDNADVWKLPDGEIRQGASENMIPLEPWKEDDGNVINTIAIEGDWHDIPSIRGLIKTDVKRVKSKVKQVLPCVEKGTFFCVKESFKKVLPNEYAALKELKEILSERNLLTNI